MNNNVLYYCMTGVIFKNNNKYIKIERENWALDFTSTAEYIDFQSGFKISFTRAYQMLDCKK